MNEKRYRCHHCQFTSTLWFFRKSYRGELLCPFCQFAGFVKEVDEEDEAARKKKRRWRR